MDEPKTKSLKKIEEKMQDLEEGSLRYHILESAKNFKSSWIELGRSLYSAWKDKMYKEWGFATFEAYVSREIGIRKQTAMKLLRSYYFLEKEEPQYLKDEFRQAAGPGELPSFETIDILRQAKNKKALDEADYTSLKKEVFEKGRDAQEVRKDVTAFIRQRTELDPEEAQEKRKLATVKRILGTLKSLKQEAEALKLLSASVLKELSGLIKKLEDEVA